MQLYATMFSKKKFAHENMKRPPSKVAHNRPQTFFSIANSNLHFCSIKIAHRATYV